MHGAVDILTPGTPYCVVIIAYVPLADVGQHSISYELLNEAGTPIRAAVGGPVISFERTIIANRPENAAADTLLLIPQTLQVGSIVLSPGRYAWRITVDGLHDPNWDARFIVRETI